MSAEIDLLGPFAVLPILPPVIDLHICVRQHDWMSRERTIAWYNLFFDESLEGGDLRTL